ncbi:MAG: NAD(P)-dependent oxidoreductase [Deltaproteobacteria bacterium]|nr:NAD(P)-dependent oxidoreductase [Deltaproteobacteria bacterium]
MATPKLAFIGFGEAAYHISRGLLKEGITGIKAYDKFINVEPQGSLIRERAKEASVELVPDLQALTHGSDIIFSAVSANLALSISEAVKDCLRPGQVFADINAASPMTKEQAALIIAPTKALFVDVAVMGPVPTSGHKVSMLVSGAGAKQFEVLKAYGMNMENLGEKAGSASALKMFRSIFMKGYVVLLLEALIAGHRYGVEDKVLESIEETLQQGPSIRENINGLLGRGVIHSERREHEMDEVLATLKAVKVDDTMSKAAKAKLRWCTDLKFKEHFGGKPPADFHDIMKAYDELTSK